MKLILAKNEGFWDAYNLGAENAIGDTFIFLDSETSIISEDTIKDLAGWASKKDVGIVGSKIIKDTKEINSIGIVLNGENIVNAYNGSKDPNYGAFGNTDWYRNFSAFSEVCVSIDKEKFNSVKGFNIKHKYFSQIDLGLKLINLDLRNTYTPYAVVENNNELTNHLKNYKALYDDLVCRYKIQDVDPYWNPNISSFNSLPIPLNDNYIPEKESSTVSIGLWDRYSADAKVLAEWFDFSSADLKSIKSLNC